jgi:hypothetical protein
MSSLLEAVREAGEESSCDASSWMVHSLQLVGALKKLPVLKHIIKTKILREGALKKLPVLKTYNF